jgi:transcriptional regulator with XRE-family HTH domain
MTSTGNLIRNQREKRNLSQKMIADYLGCTSVFISRIESGATPLPPTHADKLARILQIGKDEIMKAIKADAGTRIDKRAR